MTAINNDLPRLCLNMHDELYVIDLGQTVYFMADDHYTHVYYSNGVRFMVPFGLSRVEERLALLAVHHQHPFKRVGRKYIVNMSLIHNVNVTKQTLRPYVRLLRRECQLTLLADASTDSSAYSANRRWGTLLCTAKEEKSGTPSRAHSSAINGKR